MKEPINITFGMIVLNGEPFIRYNLRSLYPFAHQIIVVEGACPSAAAVATADGHSMDGTFEVLHDFKHREDPENKVVIVTAGDEGYTDGFWPGKDQMSACICTDGLLAITRGRLIPTSFIMRNRLYGLIRVLRD